MKIKVFLLLLIVTLSNSWMGTAVAEIYKRVDESGLVTYHNTPVNNGGSKLFNEIAKNDALLAKLNPYPKSSPLFIIYRDHQRYILTNKKFIERLLRILNSHQRTAEESFTVGTAVSEELVSSGIRRLGDGDKEQLLKLYFKMINVSSNRECAELLRGSNQAIENTNSILLRMPPRDVRQFYRLVQKAIDAELNESTFNEVTDSQKKIVTDDLSMVLANNYSLEAINTFNAITDSPLSYGDVEMCWYGKVTLKSFLSLQGDVKKWAIRHWFE